MSHPARGAWIEILFCAVLRIEVVMSHPARGAWIEITTSVSESARFTVAPREGCVD